MELDPVSQINSRNVGAALAAAGRTDEAVEQYRETTGFAPDWANGWFYLTVALLYVGEYDDGLDAWVNSSRVLNFDVEVAREAYEAMNRYRETGEPQTFPDFERRQDGLVWLHAQTGQPDRAIELFDDYYVGQGAYGLAAFNDVSLWSDLLRDDPRYQALLQQAGITW